MKLLVFGETGQVARELAALAKADLEVTCVPRAQADFADPAAAAGIVAEAEADAVINAVAYTAVDKAEEEEALARKVNAETPGAIAKACADRGLPLVHISTDYVFDGSGDEPRAPGAATAPLGAYGGTKLAGEEAVRAAGGAHAILRTSWVFSAHGANFVKTMLRLGTERDRLTIVDDQRGGPTEAADIAAACVAIARALRNEPAKSGTYHFAGAPDVSWAEFAMEIFDQAGITCEVARIPSSDYPTPAQRPLNSRLDCSATEAAFAIPRPDWRVALARVLQQK
ncbi:dTDP-4-dehydrorhamnose reductase [Vannielia litorea]|uniref:dTDP-4-dehydrorhamnose reductase n=1 Tax=Vannielia litorea TaxID=1217970 RepID=UPI001C943A95|nr:dTDP-4-dehydrorhamnose reductase [Vannielia litorea]MBY6049381.1 dTDP-4-dehydrorhamnose reductase [Vannielia litorea]MBY6076795.1 dTDP-4-dehydrorhamnose reductase [Vannielia litorea]